MGITEAGLDLQAFCRHPSSEVSIRPCKLDCEKEAKHKGN